MDGELHVIRQGFPDRPYLGTAVSEAVMRRVARGELPATLRLHVPGRELAFSRQDRASEGLDEAVSHAIEHGFAPVLRMAGGRAAVFTEWTLALALALPAQRPARTTRRRFELVAGTVASALGDLGVDARVGEVPGEYCPGAWSVNARGAVKLAGIGQRMIAGAGHVGCVVVVDGADLINAVLGPVNAALGIAWDPAATGSVVDEVGATALEEVADAILGRFAESFDLVERRLDEATLELAGALAEEHDLSAPDGVARRPGRRRPDASRTAP